MVEEYGFKKVIDIKEIIWMIKKMEKELLPGQVEIIILEIILMIKDMGMDKCTG